MSELTTPKMSHEEMMDTLKGLVFGTFNRTTSKEREALDMAIQKLHDCTDIDANIGAEMTIKKCLWELRTMRAGIKCGLQYAENDEDKEIDKEQIDALNMAIQYIMDGSSVWHSPQAMLPKDDSPVLVVNDDGKYAVAYLCRDKSGDWIDEWRIMYCPYDSDVWDSEEHGHIRAWCTLPSVPTFSAESVIHPYGWISVNDRLPNKDEYIASNGLFLVSDGNRSYAEYFDMYNSQKYFGEPTMEGFRVDRCVIKWMPLPKP